MSKPLVSLVSWYQAQAKPFLEQHDPEKVVELDRDLERLLRTDQRASAELPVCFLGASGVGKSTLINALVAGQENLVPAGGVGPLTALAMHVRYGAEPSFEVEYQPSQKLWQLGFGLEQSFMRRKQVKPAVPAEDSEPPPGLESVEAAASEPEPDPEREASRFESMRRQAAKLITDDQDAEVDVPYLLDRVRELSGRKPIWGTLARNEDASRLARLRDAVGTAKSQRRHRRVAGQDWAGFAQDLAQHATGFLAPIIREIHVFWNSPLLRPGLELVDLPGVGVAGDVYKAVTQEWIVEKARAVVLVVDNRGIREADAELLRRSGFLTRLLFSVDEPDEDPAVLIAAVTQLDNAAEDRYYQDQAKTKRKREHLADVFGEAVTLVKKQARKQLLGAWSGDAESARASQERVVDYVVDNLRVFPVSAFEFRKFEKRDEDDPSFISEAAQSGIPQMKTGLVDVTRRWRESAETHRLDATKTFVERVVTTLEVIEARWQQDVRASEEAEALRADLDLVLEPMRKEFLVRKGEFRGFLRNEIPKLISALVSEAAQQAHKDIRSYLRGLRDAHWATLRAAVTHDGAFVGARHIQLPDDFSDRFVGPIAEAWGERLLQEIRKRTRTFTGDCIAQLDALVEWCGTQGARVQPKLIESHVASVKADTKQINLVGKEALTNLRESVKNQLKAEIEKPIKRQCQAFVRKGDHIGRGVKNRILDLFDELADDATADAKPVAVDILTRGFRKVESELREVTKSFEDPLGPAADAIVASHQERIQRSDAQKRKGVLVAARMVLDARPAVDGLERATDSKGEAS